jgi:hypothetical protein
MNIKRRETVLTFDLAHKNLERFMMKVVKSKNQTPGHNYLARLWAQFAEQLYFYIADVRVQRETLEKQKRRIYKRALVKRRD